MQGAGGGATALPNSGKTVGKIGAKQEEKKSCVKFRQINPSAPLNRRVPIHPWADPEGVVGGGGGGGHTLVGGHSDFGSISSIC